MPDALVAHLNKLGYQPAFIGRTGLTPPEIYGMKDGGLMRHGPLIDYVERSGAQPFPVEDSSVPDISGVHTSGKKFAATLKFLESALRCLGVSFAPGFSLSCLKDTRLTFSIAGVTARSASPGHIVRALDFLDPALARMDEAGIELHIAHEYLYAERLLVSTRSNRTRHVAGSLDIEAFGELNTDARLVREDETTISFSHPQSARVAFAYRAGWLRLCGARWEFLPNVVVGATAGDEKIGPYLPCDGKVPWVKDAWPVEDIPAGARAR